MTPQLSFAADVTSFDFPEFGETATNVTLHGIYAVSPDVKLGVWVGRDELESIESEQYGIEAAYQMNPMSVQGYIGTGEVQATDMTYFGVAGEYGLGNGFAVIGSFDLLSIDDPDIQTTKLELGGSYAFGTGPSAFIAIGNHQYEQGGTTQVDENYFTIGASFDFGPQGGTTFNSPAFFDTFPLVGL